MAYFTATFQNSCATAHHSDASSAGLPRMLLLLGIALMAAGSMAAPSAPKGGDYSVVVLGDLHYDGDTPKKFHGKYLKTLKGAKPKCC